MVAPVTDLPQKDLPPGGVFVVTGGARGVTAVVARELGQRFGAKLHLIGSSPLPAGAENYRGFTAEELKEVKASVMKEALANGEKPIDAWGRFEKALEIDRTLHSLAEAGIQAAYHSCDVSNYDALAGLLNEIRTADGPINGVIHGAGFERASRFEKKQRELVDRTISAKVDGAFALMELTRTDPVQFFAAFGSVSGRFGGVGQTDYCTANETLSKLVDWFRRERPGCHATAIHWHAWDDVGMAVRPESQHIRKLHNIRFMPSQEGVEHLIEELRAGLPEGEIVVTELGYYQKKYLADAPAAGAVKLRPNGPQTASRRLAAPALDSRLSTRDSLPLIDSVTEVVPGQRLIAEMRLDPVGDVFLTQHRYKGRPMLPVVIAMESLAEAAQVLVGEGKQVTGLRDIEIVNGLRFHSDEPQNVRLTAAAEGGLVKCELTADVVNRRGQLLTKDRPYLRAVVETGETPNIFTAIAPSQEQEWHNCWYPEEDIVIYHGPPFRCLRQMAAVDEDAYARMVAPPLGELAGSRGEAGWILPPALLDSCFFASGIFLWVHAKGVVAIPNGIRACRLGRHPHAGEKCLVHIRYCGREEQLGLFDFVIFGEDGGVILEVDGYQNVIVAREPLDVA